MRRLILALLFLLIALPVCAGDRYALLTRTVTADKSSMLTVLNYHDVRDDIRDAGNSDATAISTDHLISHFEWLRANGFHMVSMGDIVEASHGGKPLPPKAVLLTFDDGLVSFYTHVFPLLRTYRYPALFALENSWMDMAAGETMDYNGMQCGRQCFVSWDQVREMQASGLVEMASHTFNLHDGILGNPQGSQLPAAVSLAFDAATARYETPAEYRKRVHDDLKQSADEIERQTGKRPRAIVWPYGNYAQAAQQEAASVGMTWSLSLDDDKIDALAPDTNIPRLLVTNNIGTTELAGLIYQARENVAQRVVQVDLDYVYDADPAQQEKNLSVLLDRIKRMKPTQVWLQAYADPDGDGVADAVYFPNRHLPMRADLFSRVSWQLQTRAGVEQVFAWMPVLAFRFAHDGKLPTLADTVPGKKGDHYRLAPWDPQVRRVIGDVYEDLAAHAQLTGLLFSDDAYLRDTDRLGPWAGESPAELTQKLIGFTDMLVARVKLWRPQLKTARNIYARPVLDPKAEAWFAQSLAAFNKAYDFTALMAMPQLDDAPASDRWFRKLARAVSAAPQGMERTVFELATVDWRHDDQPISAATLGHQIRLLQAEGVRHVGYYPDNFIDNKPDLEAVRPYISAASYPYQER
jgi:biofilm PGA synthesis lipoprotein PgaB